MLKTTIQIMLTIALLASGASAFTEEAPSPLPRTETWSEFWPNTEGTMEGQSVTGEIWTDVFQASLTQDHHVHISARDAPYYLDGPLVLQSGDRLTADPTAEIRLKPGTNTCMVRNAHVVGFNTMAVPADLEPDTDIHIEGGIWTTLATGDKAANGNMRGHSSKENYVYATHGVILLHNVRDVSVRNVTIRQSKAFGVHLGNVSDFMVDGVTLDRQQRDGVHVNGPARDGVIRNVRGSSHDDTVALNAWEWKNYAPSFGPIHDVRIEGISGSPLSQPSSNSLRFLPGVKRFDDGKTLDCPIYNIDIHDVTDITEFKLYEQPNLEMGRDKDFSPTPGKIHNLRLSGLTLTRPGAINIAAAVEDMVVKDVHLQFEVSPDYRLIRIGPMSMTWRHGDDPAKWVEVFAPDRDVMVRGLELGEVRVQGTSVEDSLTRFVAVTDQHPNPDYPNTTPAGGTGNATLLP